MRLFELFLDKIGDTTLFEMAESRKNAKRIITGLSPQIFKNLVKLFVLNSPENKQHWIKELNGWFNSIDNITLKPNNKKIDWQTIYNWMIFDSPPHYSASYVDNIIKKMRRQDYSTIAVYDYDSELVLNKILKILESVCKDIEEFDKFITIEDYLDL